MIHIHIFEPEETPEIRVGMRMVKTVIAVYICSVIGYLRGESYVLSMIAAVVCMQNNAENSIKRAINRILGTILGALYGVMMRYIGDWTGMVTMLPVYYLALSITLIPVLVSTLVIRKPSIAAFACTLYLSVAMAQGSSPIESSVQRVLETIIGIIVALLINIMLPKRRLSQKELKELQEMKTKIPKEEAGESVMGYEVDSEDNAVVSYEMDSEDNAVVGYEVDSEDKAVVGYEASTEEEWTRGAKT